MDRKRIYILFISFMFGVLFNLGNPAIPLFTNTLMITGRFVGIYLASNGIGLLFFATIWGAIGDIKNRHKVLAIIFAGFGIAQFLVGIFTNPYSIMIAMLLGGIFYAGVLVNLYAYINDNCDEKNERNKMLSYAVSLYLAGGAIAYLIGGLLSESFGENVHYVFILQAILLLVFGQLMYFSKTDLVDTDHHLTRRHFYANMKQVGSLPWLPIYTITLTFFISFSHNNVRRFIDYYVIDEGYSAVSLGLIVFLAGMVGLIGNIFIAPYFLKRFHYLRFHQVQFLLAPIFLFLSFITRNPLIGLYAFYIAYSLLLAVYEPTAIGLIGDNKEVNQGVVVGVRQSSVGLGMILGFIIGGFLYEIKDVYVFYLSVIFYIIVFIGFTILVKLKKAEVIQYRKNYLKEEIKC